MATIVEEYSKALKAEGKAKEAEEFMGRPRGPAHSPASS
jgi:hypothetical protein